MRKWDTVQSDEQAFRWVCSRPRAHRNASQKGRAMKHTVLIVDEDVNARIIAETLLQSRGLAASAAADGSEAYDILCCPEADVAVLLVDLSPGTAGMNGWELLRRVQARFGGLRLAAQPKVLALSRSADSETEVFARRLGADAFLSKPLAPGELIATVEHLITQHASGDGMGGSALASGGWHRR